MSMDGLGRVIVGGGHFLNHAVQAGQHVIVGGGHFLSQIGRPAETVLVNAPNMGRHVVSAVAQAEHFPGTIPQDLYLHDAYTDKCIKEAVQRAISERFPGSNPSPYDPERFRQLPSSNPPAPSSSSSSSYFPSRDEFLEEQWRLIFEGSKDILEGAGWAISGDLESALQKEIDAAMKLAELWLNDWRFLLNQPQQ